MSSDLVNELFDRALFNRSRMQRAWAEIEQLTDIMHEHGLTQRQRNRLRVVFAIHKSASDKWILTLQQIAEYYEGN